MDAAQTAQALTAIKALIGNLEASLIAILDPSIAQYTFDSGQSTQRTVRAGDRKKLTDDLLAAYSLCAVLEARSSGGGSVQVVPGW